MIRIRICHCSNTLKSCISATGQWEQNELILLLSSAWQGQKPSFVLTVRWKSYKTILATFIVRINKPNRHELALWQRRLCERMSQLLGLARCTAACSPWQRSGSSSSKHEAECEQALPEDSPKRPSRFSNVKLVFGAAWYQTTTLLWHVNINVPLISSPCFFPQEEFIYSQLLTNRFCQANEETTCVSEERRCVTMRSALRRCKYLHVKSGSS